MCHTDLTNCPFLPCPSQMMKEWATARQHVQEMRKTDPKAAEKLNREITARFQKTYEALEQEGVAERGQLGGLHQQRVQSQLNDKKRYSMEHYMTALQAPSPQVRIFVCSIIITNVNELRKRFATPKNIANSFTKQFTNTVKNNTQQANRLIDRAVSKSTHHHYFTSSRGHKTKHKQGLHRA